MNFDSWYKTSRLRYALPPMKRRQITATHLIKDFLDKCEHPYLAFSGGKDSIVTLDLIFRVQPINVMWIDEDWIMPGTLDMIHNVAQRYGIHIIHVRDHHGAREWRTMFGDYPHCNHPRTPDFEADTLPEIIKHFNFDGVALGLRADESWSRYYNLEKRDGALRKNKGDGLWHVSPIHDWSTEEVWAYIAGNNLPVHQAYIDMIDYGISPDRARVGPLTAVRVYQYGTLEICKRLWSETWRQFIADNPCIIEAGY